ncbi:hypothetical protein QFC22_003248 [Naganishia vaughanmartiniae]|uniref:Uncharacterized protein n=1 Tax=Naganishia vaughanmartiniae TaxID=1424756 RepID=A0ACC2X810_9TREE|nr:hypothetical protein QFC22_003248 [Naganishia vaughanmartiniae]
MSGNSTRPVSPGTTELSYNLPTYQTSAQHHHHRQHHHQQHQGQPQYQPSFRDLQDTVGKAQLGTVDQPSTSLEGLHVSVPHNTGSTRPNLSLDASLASSLATNLSTILGSASSTWSTQPSLQYPSVQGYSHPGSISGTPESHSRPGSVGPHVAGQQQSQKMDGSPYESSWRSHYGQNPASNGYNLGHDRDQYAYGMSHNAYNRVPAGYMSYPGATQPHHLMSMAASSNSNPSTHEADIPREPYIPPSNVGNAQSSAAFQPRAAVTGYPPNAYNMAVAAQQMQASQHGHGYPGSHVSNALLHNYSSSPIAISGLASASHNASPAGTSYNISGLMNHQHQSPYAAAAAAAGHPIGSASSSPGNTPGPSSNFTDMRNGLAGPTAARKTKYTRSRTGCLACRVKRVKCDESRPECKRCIGAKRDCVFPSLADLPKATIRALTAKKRKESGSDLDDQALAGLNSGDVSTATSANASGDETDSSRSRILLSAPRGENLAVDALRLGLLGVGAIHQAFLFAKNQNGLSQTSSLLGRARTLREAAGDMLLAASRDPETAKHDAAIAAGATNALIDAAPESPDI